VLIAHALGDAGQVRQNTIAALERSASSGLRLLELDVWLDADGALRCHHGPDAPPPLQPGECTPLLAAQAALARQAWLVLDIKTDFAATTQAIGREFKGRPEAARLIFQLYRPGDIAHYAEWAAALNLPGPIITAYRARRSLGHIAGQAARLGVRAFTFPLYRGDALGPAPAGVSRLVHPVHDCPELAEARRLAADGFYLTTDLLPRVRAECRP
jgi:hypothetical protein